MPRHSGWQRQLIRDFTGTLASCDLADVTEVRRSLARDDWNGACLPVDDGGLGLTAADAAGLAEQLGLAQGPSDPLDVLAALPLLTRTAPGLAQEVRAGRYSVGMAVPRPVAGGQRARPDAGGAGREEHATPSTRPGDRRAWHPGPALFTRTAPDVVLLPAPDAPDAVTGWRPAAVTPRPTPGDPLVGVAPDAPGTAHPGLVGVYAGPLWAAGTLLRNAHLLGLARSALARAVDRARGRLQFGRPIGSYQAVAFPLASQRARLEGLRLANDARLRELDAGGEDIAPERAWRALADALALTAAITALLNDCVRHAVHVHGAFGLHDGSPVAACHRRLLTETARWGQQGLVDGPLPRRSDAEPGRRDAAARRRRSAPQRLARLREPVSVRDNEVRYPADRCVHELVERAAARHPGAVAVRSAEGDLGYARLDADAERLAGALRRRGIGAGDLVGLHMEHGPQAVTAILAVLKAGAAYLPLDPALPPERTAFLTEDAQAALVVSDVRLRDALPSLRAPVTTLPDLARTPPDPRAGRRPAAPDSLVYVLYTSGSTGTPKGVEVEHRNLANRLYWDADTFPLHPSDAVLHHTSLGFDISVWEIFAPLVSGATLVVPPPEALRDPHRMLTLMRDTGVTVLGCVPSLLDVLLDEDDPALADVTGLRYVFCGGETLPPGVVDRFHALGLPAELHNFYGPSECTIDVTSWRCGPGAGGAPVPIGAPLANVGVHVLDENGEVVPPGRPGELYVGGAGVARGYRRRPGQTARCFLPDPFTDRPAARMYRTGDRVRMDRAGVLHFLGRTDRQVKIHGHRVELGEIQHALERHPGVRAAAVRAVEDRIEAHVVAADGSPPDVPELTRHLRGTLPAYMVPAAFGFRSALPVTGNGKTDYAALPCLRPGIHGPRGAAGTADGGRPDALEDALARLAGRLLGRDRLDPGDDFFAAGGSSLHAARFVSRARTEHGLDVRLEHFLAAPTVRDLVKSAAHAREGDHPDD
ncbi:amino acid adenylation domain-containing protein [Streptomyces naphthomycinicus]|uniref:amino acid adenylation domain-containing protein n=1 Tax=Streptomyces naphthomycinicus TaxID=2872625 RepID=UPI001CECE34E|nr:amino acid adenylation domain-containing protein [Streptomyces sp. TML10]